jgi:hypothetical protein
LIIAVKSGAASTLIPIAGAGRVVQVEVGVDDGDLRFQDRLIPARKKVNSRLLQLD